LEVSTAGKSRVLSFDAITLVVNGEVHQIAVEPQWTLQYVLMDKLGLTGTKEFCAEGACGACSVILDGRPVLSCMTLAIECANSEIETIEGIARANHPLIDAYVKHSCMQCGFCTPGFIVTAKALLDRNPDPTVDEIKEAMVGNLCRCGTYPAHLRAITEAARVLRGLVETDTGATTISSVPANAAVGARAAGMARGGVGPSAPVGPTEGGARQ
jgi:aerobic-type carbon monoxide dehydrogenase small subunit (CoxS/CutS family)